MADMLNEMNMKLSDEDLEAACGGDSTMTLDGRKILCKKYTMTTTDTLASVAKKYNTTVAMIMKVNTWIKSPTQKLTGKVILVPVNCKS
ncbi:MAG: LysM domain-containing protein [Lachnospiraceae bacterium]|nr:LysM domain-containing protein [Lachnospiraceae bacterium]